jgi:S1-C subfamily serine protease
MTPDQIYERTQESVVTIQTYDSRGMNIGSGRGVVISDDGIIVSNHHVFAECVDFKVSAGSVTLGELDVLYYDEKIDLILLKAKKGILNPLNLCDPQKIKVGQIVYSIGNPLGEFENSIASGLISGFRNMNGNDFKHIQFTSSISPGNSGGALVNETCELVGITTFHRRGGNDLYFAVPASLITEALAASKTYVPANGLFWVSCET